MHPGFYILGKVAMIKAIKLFKRGYSLAFLKMCFYFCLTGKGYEKQVQEDAAKIGAET